ncbi:hypothetical protein DFH06DRAFT_1444554 [Mycena polygramma]|nr:hypothetical protein DFH06DRAFT_1444554 [Mycena polygramma]
MSDADFRATPTPPATSIETLSRSQLSTLKRRASASFTDGLDDSVSRKRMKEEREDSERPGESTGTIATADEDSALAEQLAQELQCGCCSGLVYRPVIVAPCQHFFCGSCCVLWIRNGGVNCPHCRGQSTSVTPSRILQSVLDVLLRAAPSKARSLEERIQADEIYTGTSMRLPGPREVSPEPDINPSDFVRPCPNCILGNPYGWRCPNPIVDPNVDPDNAWHLDDGNPPGHALCGNCENMLALPSPLTTKCDFCQVSFCGIGVQGRCIASPILSQHPHGLSDVGDLIQCSAVYECFNRSVEIMFDYLTAQRITPRHIYREIVTHIQAQPRAFLPLIELELFPDPEPEAPRSRICRQCASEVLLYGLRDWFLRERQKGFLEESVLSRKDCVDGADCGRQRDLAHAKEFNHLISNPVAVGQPETEGPIPVAVAQEDDTDMPPPPSPETSTADIPVDEAATGTSSVPIAFDGSPPTDIPVVHETASVPKE